MKKGDKGQAVFNLQSDLTLVGFPVGIDGMYGPQTWAAVEAFQKTFGLKVDGIAGPQTLGKLAEVKASHNVPTPPPAPIPDGQVKGIDVSNYQVGSDWARVAGAGVRYAFIKATEGTGYVNPHWKSDYIAAKAHGLIVGTYHFFHPNVDAAAQAKHYIGNLLGTVSAEDLPPCLDLEQSNGIGPGQVLTQSLLFLNAVRDAFNKQPILYTMPDMINQLGHPASLHEFPLWIAGPGRSSAPVVQPWGTNWSFWQNNFKATVPGIQGPDDTDVFNGSFEQLKDFAAETLHVDLPPAA